MTKQPARQIHELQDNEAIYITPRYHWLPKWFMRWAWFRVATIVKPVSLRKVQTMTTEYTGFT